MSHATYTHWNGQKFPLSKEEFEFIERNDLWDGLSEYTHMWDIDNDPGAWDLMMETFIPFFTIEGKTE